MKLITRAQWGARPPDAVSTIATPTAVLALHHFAIDRRGPAGARWCQNLHMDDRRMNDVAYTLMADHEAVYEGRGPGVEGGHTRGWNDRAHAVAAMVDGRTAVDDAVLDRLAEAAVWLWREGAVAAPRYTGGHRDYSASSCPGDELQASIPEINRRATGLAGGGTTSEEDDMLRRGDRNPHVSALQFRLANWYGIPCKVDGWFGENTENALKKWERSVGLPDDGVFSHMDLVLFGSEHDARRQRELDRRLDRLEP